MVLAHDDDAALEAAESILMAAECATELGAEPEPERENEGAGAIVWPVGIVIASCVVALAWHGCARLAA